MWACLRCLSMTRSIGSAFFAWPAKGPIAEATRADCA